MSPAYWGVVILEQTDSMSRKGILFPVKLRNTVQVSTYVLCVFKSIVWHLKQREVLLCDSFVACQVVPVEIAWYPLSLSIL